MAMFGNGGGGNFDPSNWVDHNVYNEIMNGDNGGSYHHHNNNKNRNHIDKDSKILLWISLGGFGFWLFIGGIVFSATQESDYIIRSIFALIPFIWPIFSLVIGLIIISHKNNKKKPKNDSKNNDSKINEK